MANIEYVKRRIESAESELKAAKAELKELQEVEPEYIKSVRTYLHQIGCNHSVTTICGDRTIVVLDRFMFNASELYDALQGHNVEINMGRNHLRFHR